MVKAVNSEGESAPLEVDTIVAPKTKIGRCFSLSQLDTFTPNNINTYNNSCIQIFNKKNYKLS